MADRYSNFGIPFADFEITTRYGDPPAAPSVAGLVALFTPTNGVDETPAIVAQPSTASNTGIILTMTVTDANSSITYAKAWVNGTDRHGRAISDTITATPSGGSATYYSTKVFYGVTDVTTHVDGRDGGDQISLGWSGYDAGGSGGFGLPFDVFEAADIYAIGIDNVADGGTIDDTNMVWHPATIQNGARRYRISGRSTL